LGGRKGIRPVKDGGGGGGHWLVRMEWRPAGCSMCLPLLIFPCPEVLFWHQFTRVIPEKDRKMVVVVVLLSFVVQYTCL